MTFWSPTKRVIEIQQCQAASLYFREAEVKEANQQSSRGLKAALEPSAEVAHISMPLSFFKIKNYHDKGYLSALSLLLSCLFLLKTYCMLNMRSH